MIDQLLAPFLTWQFILAAVLINAMLISVRRFVRTVNPLLLERRWFKAAQTVANPLLGLLMAFVPDFLYGSRLVERLFVGVCAGFLSHFIYGLFVKRLAPGSKVEPGAPSMEIPASEADTAVDEKAPKNRKI